MPRPCSLDLRMRVLREVEAGASRREAAECVEVSASSAIKWMQRLNETGSIAAKPSGGSISPLEAHAAVLLGLIAEQADLTLDEIVAVMRKRRIAGQAEQLGGWMVFVLGLGLLIFIVVAAIFVGRHETQLTALAEQALPGPLEIP